VVVEGVHILLEELLDQGVLAAVVLAVKALLELLVLLTQVAAVALLVLIHQ
jgi:hypothetical protein